MERLLVIRDLVTVFRDGNRRVVAVDGVSFDVHRGEVFGLVGESGCGKSVTCRSITRLFGGAAARIEGGSIVFEGTDLVKLTDYRMMQIRGAGIAMVFQDPMSSLNPTMRIGNQIDEAVQRHHGFSRKDVRAETIQLLERVGVASAARRADAWPHEFSGGMRQRVMIAMALAGRPRLLIADEPTTALDVTIQDQILKLLLGLRHEFGMSILLVTHDLGVVAQTCDRVAVMYAGRIAECATTAELFTRPRHPYTEALLAALPARQRRGQSLRAIGGMPPDLAMPPPGCRFHPRCAYVEEACVVAEPPLVDIGNRHLTACRRHEILP
jgi:oligopeptide/dipeptide ABC transporter ATP-binding protein